jgi:cytochrome c2
VAGAPIGGTRYANYSDWMRAQETTWTPDRLAAFLQDPTVLAPGTLMPDPGIDDPEEIGAVVDFLAAMASPLEFTPKSVDLAEPAAGVTN